MIKKSLSLLMCAIIFYGMMLPVSAVDTDNDTGVDQTTRQDYIFDDGVIQICQSDNMVVVSVDQHDSMQQASAMCVRYMSESFSESTFKENRTQTSTAYIPNDGTSAEELYNNMTQTMSEITPLSTQYAAKELSGTDQAYCATFNMKINYTKETVDGEVFYDITSVTGGFYDAYTTGSYVGENVYVTALTLDIGQTGALLSSGKPIVEQSLLDEDLPVSRTWTYYPPSSWVPVQDAGAGTAVGATYHFTLTRGNSSWTDSLHIIVLGTLHARP